MYLQSIKDVKHNAAKSINRSILKKSRHYGFSVFKIPSSMDGGIGGRESKGSRRRRREESGDGEEGKREKREKEQSSERKGER